jgi:Na+/melibiose symporter-like transporter
VERLHLAASFQASRQVHRMTWRNFGKALALVLIGQAVVRMALADATDTPTNLFWSGIALAVMMMLISFILNVIASVREADRSRQDLP